MPRYIDRIELVKNLDRFAHEHLTPLLRTLIEKQPTADVEEVKHSEWKKISVSSEHGYGQVYYQHSSCEINSTELFQCPYERCPRCGAKMDGDKK